MSLPCLESLKVSWEKETGDPLSDLERLYEDLTFLNTGTITSITPRLPASFPVHSREIELLEWEFKKFQEICTAALPSVRLEDLDYLRPILKFTKLTKPLVIISLNYDPCIELIMGDARISWTDGAPSNNEEFFGSRLDFAENTDVHLVKLPGSATWYQTRLETEPGWMRRVHGIGQAGVSRKLGVARTITHAHEAMMIYPTLNKALTNGPFLTLTLKAQRALPETSYASQYRGSFVPFEGTRARAACPER